MCKEARPPSMANSVLAKIVSLKYLPAQSSVSAPGIVDHLLCSEDCSMPVPHKAPHNKIKKAISTDNHKSTSMRQVLSWERR